MQLYSLWRVHKTRQRNPNRGGSKKDQIGEGKIWAISMSLKEYKITEVPKNIFSVVACPREIWTTAKANMDELLKNQLATERLEERLEV